MSKDSLGLDHGRNSAPDYVSVPDPVSGDSGASVVVNRRNVNRYARRIRDAVNACDSGQLADALEWYADAREVAVTVAARLDVSVTAGACIVSALSPRCPWSRNVALALDYADGREVRTLGAHVAKCDAIVADDRAGRDPLAQFVHTGAPGTKTGSFARAIAGDSDAITVDVWMLRAAGITDRDAPTTRQYREIAHAVRRVASERGISPAACQAAAWVGARGSAD